MSHKPSPAISVSCICFQNRLFVLVTEAMPPCAKLVFASSNNVLHNIATLPLWATFKAKLIPAIPLPITIKSNLHYHNHIF